MVGPFPRCGHRASSYELGRASAVSVRSELSCSLTKMGYITNLHIYRVNWGGCIVYKCFNKGWMIKNEKF